MTHDQFKQEVDGIDTGLPQGPDLTSIRAQGRTVRRRRRAMATVSGLAAAAVLAVPLATVGLDGSDDATVQVADGASTTATPTPTPTTPAPTVDPSAYADQSQRMTASVADVFPQARRTSDEAYDSMVRLDNGTIDIALGDPVDWGSVFRWNQEFALDDLQFFTVSASWDSAMSGMQLCSVGMFARESDCTVDQLDGGYSLVRHDGVQLRGEPDGDWTRFVQLVSPPSERGLVQLVEVWAQEEDMTWAEAASALPPLDDLAAIATDERMRLPEPLALPEPE